MARIRKDIFLTSAQITTSGTTNHPAINGEYGISEFDPALYSEIDGVYFEANLTMTDSGGAAPPFSGSIYLRDKSDDSIVATLTMTSNSPTWQLIKSSDIKSSLTSATELYVNAKSNSSQYVMHVRAARLIIIQDGTIYKTATHYMIGDDYNMASRFATEMPLRRRAYFDANNFDGTLDYFYHATIWTNDRAVGCTSDLYDTTNSAIKATVTTTSSTPDLVKDTTVTLVDDAEITARIHSTAITRKSVDIGNAQVIITQDGGETALTKTISPLTEFCMTFVSSSDAYSPTDRKMVEYDTTEFTGCDIDSDSEFSLKTTANTGYAKLLAGTSDITNSAVSTVSTSYVRLRGSSLTEPSTNYINWGIKVSATATVTITTARMIILITNMEEASTGTNMKINVGDEFKTITAIKINIGDVFKDVTSVKKNISNTWNTIF